MLVQLLVPVVAVAAALPFVVTSDETEVNDRIIDIGMNQSQVMDHLGVLTNEIGPRLTGSDNIARAYEITRKMFRRFGLDARTEEWGEYAVGFNRGPWYGRMLSPEAIELECGTNSWTAGTNGPQKGTLVKGPTNTEELAAMRAGLHGAWVLSVGGGNSRDPARRAFNTERDAAFEEEGVLGVISSTRDHLIVTGGNSRLTWDNLPTIPQIKLVKKQFEDLAARLENGEQVVLEFDINAEFIKGPVKHFNVIADIPGREFPDQYVIVGGHLDSWDCATGTTDNGTGCATTLEAARILAEAGARPRRTIRFMLWSGEEQGLQGSRAYVARHPEEMPNISAVLVHDGGTNFCAGLSHTAAMKEDLERILKPCFDVGDELSFSLNEVGGLRGGGSDHSSFLGAGVPGFFWRQSGRAVYRETHHTQKDYYDSAIPEYQRHSATVIALTALAIADMDHLLSREGLQAPRGQRGQGGGRRRMGIQLSEDGVTIQGVTDGSLAAQAGWKAGDKILKLGDKEVKDRDELLRAMRDGSPVMIFVLKRDGKELRFKLDWNENKASQIKDA